MPIDKEVVGQVIEQSGGVFNKVYDDLAHPTARSLGNTLSLLPRTIGVWLGKWEKWVINGEESIRLTAQAVQEKAAKIPEEKLTEPEPYVAIPAVQQLSYCYDSEELREMYANLLVSSMNIDTKQAVHPARLAIETGLLRKACSQCRRCVGEDLHQSAAGFVPCQQRGLQPAEIRSQGQGVRGAVP